MRTRREWHRSSWNRPTGDELKQLLALREFLSERLPEDGAEFVSIPTAELRELLDLTTPAPLTRGAVVEDKDRGVEYRVTLDTTTKPGEPRLRSVEVVRTVIGDGLKGWSAKGGLHRVGKAGTYLAPYDEAVFRIPIQVLVSQALAVQASEDTMGAEHGARGIVIGSRKLAPPTPEQLRELLRTMTVQQIAERYDRKSRMVYGWLAAAREAAPELDWPEVKHGPVSKSTDDNSSSANKKGTK